jgi:glucose-6-phosphate 1-dehydrogenase
LTDTTPPHEYQPGTWGPAEADRLIDRPGGWAKPFATRAEP